MRQQPWDRSDDCRRWHPGVLAFLPYFPERRSIPVTNLTHASRELFTRTADERYKSLPDLLRATTEMKNRSVSTTMSRRQLHPSVHDSYLSFERSGSMRLNEWSFTQLCQLAG